MKTTARTLGSFPTGQTAAKDFGFSVNVDRYREIYLLISPLLLFSAYPLLRAFEHAGNADVFGSVKMTGSLIALSAGFAFIARFSAPGRRLYLFAGLAFCFAGAEDLAIGFMLAGKSLLLFSRGIYDPFAVAEAEFAETYERFREKREPAESSVLR